MNKVSISKLKTLSGTEWQALESPTAVTYNRKVIKELHNPSAIPIPVPVPEPTPTDKPSSIVGKNWTIIGPHNKPSTTNSPENQFISKAEAMDSYKPYFFMRNGAVVFKTPANGATTTNSKYSRTELREYNSPDDWDKPAAWSNTSGTHTIEGEYSVKHTFTKRPQVVFQQIHAGGDDLTQSAVDGNRIVQFFEDKSKVFELSPTIPAKFKVKTVASGGRVKVYFNGELKVDYAKSGSSLYFKSGNYNQSNVKDWGESPDAYGETTIYSLSVSHN